MSSVAHATTKLGRELKVTHQRVAPDRGRSLMTTIALCPVPCVVRPASSCRHSSLLSHVIDDGWFLRRACPAVWVASVGPLHAVLTAPHSDSISLPGRQSRLNDDQLSTRPSSSLHRRDSFIPSLWRTTFAFMEIRPEKKILFTLRFVSTAVRY